MTSSSRRCESKGAPIEPDPRLLAASESYTRLLDIAQQCLDEGKARWTTALDRQQALIEACIKPPGAAPEAGGS